MICDEDCFNCKYPDCIVEMTPIEKRRVYDREYYQRTKKDRIASSRKYQKKNKEKIKAYNREYQREYQKRPEVRRKRKEARQKKRQQEKKEKSNQKKLV